MREAGGDFGDHPVWPAFHDTVTRYRIPHAYFHDMIDGVSSDLSPQSIKTFEQKLRFQHGELTLPRHYIYCKRCPPDDRFRQFYDRARREDWGHYEIDASHNPHITAPEELAVLLDRIAK